MSKQRCWGVVPAVRQQSEADAFSDLALPVAGRGTSKLLIGRREWLALPDLEVDCISAKIDTGAYTSSLHAEDIELFRRKRADWVRFVTHNHHGGRRVCEAPVDYEKRVRSSTGRGRKRIFIQTVVRTAGGLEWRVRVSLADRSVMKCPMLLGRKALSGRFLVDSASSHVFGSLHDLTGVKPRRKRK
jgi:ribosomal protein S6--L-glutamate ligase